MHKKTHDRLPAVGSCRNLDYLRQAPTASPTTTTTTPATCRIFTNIAANLLSPAPFVKSDCLKKLNRLPEPQIRPPSKDTLPKPGKNRPRLRVMAFNGKNHPQGHPISKYAESVAIADHSPAILGATSRSPKCQPLPELQKRHAACSFKSAHIHPPIQSQSQQLVKQGSRRHTPSPPILLPCFIESVETPPFFT